MPLIFFLLFVVLPFVELALLLQIGGEIGALNTIALIVGTGLVGGYLAKREGFAVWSRFQQKLSQGGMPGDELIDGLIILVSAALLVTPGVITDVVGFLGLLPPSRYAIKSQIRKRLFIDTASRVVGGFQSTRAYYQSRNTPPRGADPDAEERPTVETYTRAQGSTESSRRRVDITEIVEDQARSGS